ncbi:MAG: HEAT repeat domain-containing protein, partial [Armatimonadota bacterium]
MKLKTGPLLVIGSLVLLVGLTLLLSPAPPPAQPKDAAKDAEAEKKTDKKKVEKPKADLSAIKAAISGENPDAAKKGMDDLQEAIVTTRDAGEKAPFVAYAVSLAQTDRREGVRANALNLLKSVADLDSNVPMNIAKTDSSPQVREAALLALSRFPAGGAVEETLKQFANNPDPGLRNAAVISLTQMLATTGQAGAEGLVKLLGQQDNDAAAKAALTLQGQGPSALPVLIKTLYTSPSGPARHGAAECIALICSGYNPSIDEFAHQAQVTHRQEAGHR